MAGGKEIPRQKMIGMMYLVLTALLALNVSKEIINAFVTQDNQMLVNNNNLVEVINGFMAKFSMMEVDPTTKKTFEKWKPKTQKVNKLSNELDDYLIQNLNQMMEESEDKKDFFVKTKETQYTTWEPIESISNKEDYDIATRLFGGEKQSPGYKKGGEIRLKLLELRDSLIYTMGNYSERGKIYQVKNEWLSSIEVLDKQLTETSHPDKLKLLSIYNSLNQPETLKNHDKDQEWQLVKFDYQPIVGAIGVFTELRNQVRMAQKQALELITSKLDGQIMKINKIEPQIIASTRYLNQGDTMGVRVGIVAFDSTATYPIKYQVGSQQLESNSNRFTLRAGSVGKQQVKGSLMLDLADGKKEFPWSFEYTVGKPTGTISCPEYNVLYAGYDNLIEASISGYAPNDVTVKCEGCTSFTKKGNNYVAKVSGSGDVKIKATAKGTVIVRKYKIIGKPKPELSFLGKQYGVISLGNAKRGSRLVIRAPKISPLQIQYEIVSFEFEMYSNGRNLSESLRSADLNAKAKGILRNVQRGGKIYISEVKYREVGSSKILRMNGITLKVV
ncbi:hypothetical protein OAD28_05350 [Flavobacteriales bacterium]|nr:hypothetical protein [Flavobacteriales bacterium]